MRTIVRQKAPECLRRQPQSQPWNKFMRTACHGEVTRRLREEQHQLCCYCEVDLSDSNCHVEHMEPRDERKNGARTYDYENLAASCNGGRVEHCGHFKDAPTRQRHKFDAKRFVPPHDPATTLLFRYRPVNGAIYPAEGLNEQQRARADYMIGYLGLDCPRLAGRRRTHAKGLTELIKKAPDTVAWLKQEYLHPDPNGCLKEFHSLSKAILEP